MSVNSVPISARNMPMDPTMTAGGGFTVPTHVFIPHPSTTPFTAGTGFIGSPGARSGAIEPNKTVRVPRPGMVPNGVYAINRGSR